MAKELLSSYRASAACADLNLSIYLSIYILYIYIYVQQPPLEDVALWGRRGIVERYSPELTQDFSGRTAPNPPEKKSKPRGLALDNFPIFKISGSWAQI